MRRAAVLMLVLAVLGCGGSSAVKQPATPRVGAVKQALIARLKQKQLIFHWVACVGNGRTYRRLPIVRCNVNFGMDPHVEAYCSVLEQGRLVTNHENSAIPCSHDDAGFPPSVVASGS